MTWDDIILKADKDKRLFLSKVEALVNALIKSLGLEQIQTKIKRFIKQKYVKGVEKAEEFFDMNFPIDNEKLSFLQDYVDGVVGNTADAINQDMRDIIKRAVLDDADVADIKKRVKEEFNSEKYMNRFKTIMRTEGQRAGNQGQLDSAKQAPFEVKKYLDIVRDERTSPICIQEDAKYGTKDKAIPLDEDFEVTVKNKTYITAVPPFHPNCRSVVRFVESD